MYSLKNDFLDVTLLDPVADQDRFGPRYCTGGYIYQITDAQAGPLLSGPTYPDNFNWFDGQGIPDAFNLGPLREPSADPLALIIGIGICDLQANEVKEFCLWDVTETETAITMQTSQTFHHYDLALERTVALSGRTVRSTTRLINTSRRAIPVRWFPHPFFPHPHTDELCRVNFPVGLGDSTGYELIDSGFIARKGWPWDAGHFQALDHNAQSNLVILQKHPILGLIAATCSYAPDFFPIWGNQHTFSWEPYLERTVGAGQTLSWWIDYDF
jgi:hypothetical protein